MMDDFISIPDDLIEFFEWLFFDVEASDEAWLNAIAGHEGDPTGVDAAGTYIGD